MREIEIKNGAKTVIKLVPDNWEPTDEFEQKDLTTSQRKSIGYSDIPVERWNSIFTKERKVCDENRKTIKV